MLHTTFAKAHEANTCKESYRKMAKTLGGVRHYGKDTPISLSKVLEVCGLQDAIWALRCTEEPSENILIEFACRCAEHVLHFYTEKYPDDKRPQQAIAAARVCITDKSPAAGAAAGAADDAVGAAWAAAWDAARAAAWDAAAGAARAAGAAARAAAGAAAGDAAWDAVWDAVWAARDAWATEQEWQTKTLLEILITE